MLDHQRDAIVRKPVVRVQDIDEWRGGQADRFVDRRGRSAILPGDEAAGKRRVRQRATRYLRRGVGRAIIDDNQLDLPIRLRKYRFDRTLDESRVVVARHDDGHRRPCIIRRTVLPARRPGTPDDTCPCRAPLGHHGHGRSPIPGYSETSETAMPVRSSACNINCAASLQSPCSNRSTPSICRASGTSGAIATTSR